MVNNFIERDAVIQRDLSRGLINTSALAKYLIKEGKINASPDAVITAIRRNIEDNDYSKRFKDKKKIFIDSRVSSKNKMALVVLEKGEATLNLLSELFNKINIHSGETIRLVKSSESLEILIDEKNLDKVLSVFAEDKIKRIRKNMGVVTINLSHDKLSKLEMTPGVFASVLNELAISNINALETILCLYEIMIFVDEKELLKAYEVLMGLCGK
ncbi:MAG: hypothetical protein KAS87_00890 [Candidatus Omnitrophica bacterium]|nr:hypothetical protein [Candidatus Omnitrophota bacterium]